MERIIERYVYDVTRRLPENQRKEVEKELLANINDMVGENPSESDIEEVLLSLGHPRKLANEYRDKHRYLIGPEWMEDYLLVLKIVIIALGGIALITGLVTNILNPESNHFFGILADVFFNTLSRVVSACLTGFAIVTLVFMSIEYHNSNRKAKFKLKNLPEIPAKKSNEISRVGSITSLVFTVIFSSIFIYLLLTDKFNIFYFDSNLEIQVIVAIFNSSVLSKLIPLIITSFVINILAEVYRLFKNKWDLQMYIVYSVARIFAAVVGYIFFTTNNILNVDLIGEIAEFFDTSYHNVFNGIYDVFTLLSIVIVVATLIELITTLFKKEILKVKKRLN